jgi:hypothetical protein
MSKIFAAGGIYTIINYFFAWLDGVVVLVTIIVM